MTIEALELSEDVKTFMLATSRPSEMFPMIEDIYSIGQARWFVIYTNPKCEGRAERVLREKGVEAYTPKTKDWRKQSKKDIHQRKPKIEIVKPLLTRYAFVKLPVSERGEIPFGYIRTVDGVREIVGTSDGPLTVSDAVISKIQQREAAGEFDKTVKKSVSRRRGGESKRKTIVPQWVDVGVPVNVLDGPFSMFQGLIEEILPNERVKVGLSLFGRLTTVELTVDAVSDAR